MLGDETTVSGLGESAKIHRSSFIDITKLS